MKHLCAAALLVATAHAEPALDPRGTSVAIHAGLLQPVLLGGANVEADVRHGHFVVAYSHGWNLRMEDSAISGDMARQGIVLRIPFTTGIGIGASTWLPALRSFVDVRAEAKAHRFEVAYADAGMRTDVTSYTTLTLGAGAYWTLVPFASRTDALRGLAVAASVRYWPTVYASRDDVSYANARTGQMEIHEAANIGIANTPLIVNLSIGYVFQ